MIFSELNGDNFLLFAIKHYENPQAVTKEDFDKDLNHFKYIKRLLKRYRNNGEKIQKLTFFLIISSYFIIFLGKQLHQCCSSKLKKNFENPMKSFIVFLDKLPSYPKCYVHDIDADEYCLSELNRIYNEKGKS